MDNYTMSPSVAASKSMLKKKPYASENLVYRLTMEYARSSAISKPAHEPAMISTAITFGELYELYTAHRLYAPGGQVQYALPIGGADSERMLLYKEGECYYILFGVRQFKMCQHVYEMNKKAHKEVLSAKIYIAYAENMSYEHLRYLIVKYNYPDPFVIDEKAAAESPAEDVVSAEESEAPAVSKEPAAPEAEKSSVDNRGLSINILSTLILEQAKSAKELSYTVQKVAAVSQNRHAGSSCISLVSAVYRKLNNRWYWQCGPPSDLPEAG